MKGPHPQGKGRRFRPWSGSSSLPRDEAEHTTATSKSGGRFRSRRGSLPGLQVATFSLGAPLAQGEGGSLPSSS